MLRKLLMFVAGAFALTLAPVVAEDKTPTVKEIMTKGHKGTDNLMTKVTAAAKAEKWDDAKTSAELLKTFGEGLGKNKNKKGDADSWKTLTEKYAKNTAAIADAVEKKDAGAVTAALGTVGKSCKECHSVHK